MSTVNWRTNRYYRDGMGNRCLFVDTLDPYVLMKEAQEARELLANHYVNGSEFSLYGLGAVAFTHAMEMKQRGRIPSMCSIGAVFYVQGHHANQCNLILALNEKSRKMFGIKVRDSDGEPCSCGEPDCNGTTYIEFDTIVAVNDGPDGKNRALAVFDAVIADYTQEVMRAEWMAEDYPEPSFGDELHHRLGSVFKYTHSGPPVNYGCDTPATVELDQVIEWTQ